MIVRATARWAATALAYFEDVSGIVNAHIKRLMEDHFENFEQLLNIVK